jgi:outer membrane receptor protein involved in Fe transport
LKGSKPEIVKKTAVVFILLMFYARVNAQNIISGTVKNSLTQEAMPGVTVNIKGTGISSLSDNKGNFRITADKKLPLILLFTSASFEPFEIKVSDNNTELQVQMIPWNHLLNPVVVGATRISTRLLNAPVSIEVLSAKKIENAAAFDYYGLAATLKGVDLTTSGVLFKTISTRGFNTSGSLRVNQLVDGMDNQIAALNFNIANFIGVPELDVASMELLPGATSALYGPGGMNGTILIYSKDPFKTPGLSIQVKQGVMNLGKQHRQNATSYSDFSFRWAKSFKNKFAFKINAQYITAKDWLADDSSDYQGAGSSTKLVAGNRQSDPNYNGVNVYGDETSVDLRAFMNSSPDLQTMFANFLTTPQSVSRTGYAEKDLSDPPTNNLKLSGALHYRITEKIEAQLLGYWATGTTSYTGDSRYSFKNIRLGQYKLELKHKNWFLRAYTSREKAGEANSISITAQYLNEGWKPSYDPSNIDGSWYPQYFGAFATGAGQIFQSVLGNGGSLSQAQAAVYNAASQLHAAGRAFADQGRPVPGSSQFIQLYDHYKNIPIPNGGLFYDKSYIWYEEGQYDFTGKIKFADIIVGASHKTYNLSSNGSLFIDTLKPITINESAFYTQVSKKLFNERLTLAFSGRYDKNEDFKARFTPRATALIQLAKNNNLRMSYQTAYRFPSTQQKYLRLNEGAFTVLGGLPWVVDYMHVKKDPVYELINFVPASTPYVYKAFKPESVRSFEFGYKGLIANRLLIDAYGYFGQYENFIGTNTLLQPSTGIVFVTYINSPEKISTHGFGLGLDYQLPKAYNVYLNTYSDVVSHVPDGFKAYFNTPKYRLNAGFSNSSLGKNKNYGFNVVLHWQDAFFYESDFVDGPVNAYSTIDAQLSDRLLKNKSLMIKLGGNNILNHYYKNGFAHPYVGAVYYVSFLYSLL